MAMHSDLAEVFAHLRRGPDPVLDPVSAMRSMVEGYGMGCAGEGLTACRVGPVQVGARAAEWLVPPEAGERRIVYLHGGGWVAGSLASHRAIAAELALLSGMAVLVPDYRLAPEHPFPAALIDCAAALTHAAANGPDSPGACDRLALAGDSAGGNLAAAVALGLAPLADVPRPERLMLFSPFLGVEPVNGGFAHEPDDPAVAGEELAAAAGMAGDLQARLGRLVTVFATGTEINNGQVKDTNLNSYTPLRMADVPDLDIEFMPSTEPPVGLGEPATTVVGPAIGNAIYRAVGARVRDLPIRPAAVKAAMKA